MAEATHFTFSYSEIVEALVKTQGIHEGVWSLQIEFGLGTLNVNKEVGSKDVTPAALLLIQKLGISRVQEENSLTVDAAKVNPKNLGTSKRGKSK